MRHTASAPMQLWYTIKHRIVICFPSLSSRKSSLLGCCSLGGYGTQEFHTHGSTVWSGLEPWRMYCVHWNTRNARLARKSRALSNPATGRSWKPVRPSNTSKIIQNIHRSSEQYHRWFQTASRLTLFFWAPKRCSDLSLPAQYGREPAVSPVVYLKDRITIAYASVTISELATGRWYSASGKVTEGSVVIDLWLR